MEDYSHVDWKALVDVDVSYDERRVRVFDEETRVSIRVTASDTRGVDVPSLDDVRIGHSATSASDSIRAGESGVAIDCDGGMRLIGRCSRWHDCSGRGQEETYETEENEDRSEPNRVHRLLPLMIKSYTQNGCAGTKG